MSHEINKTEWSCCKICKKTVNEIKKEIGGKNEYFSSAFSKHLKKDHNLSLSDYFINVIGLEDKKCKCGQCGKSVKIKTNGAKIEYNQFACGRNEGLLKWSEEAKENRKGDKNPMFNKNPWNKNETKESSESLNIVSKKLTGRKIREETKQKQSNSAKNRLIHGHTGHKHSEYSKQLIRNSTLKRIKNKEFKQTNTKPHKLFKDILYSLDIKFEEECIVGFYNLDFYLPKFNIYIEVDGDYFHSNPKFYPNGPESKTQKKNHTNDQRKNKFFNDNKLTLIRYWEFDIINNKEEIICSLKKLLESYQ